MTTVKQKLDALKALLLQKKWTDQKISDLSREILELDPSPELIKSCGLKSIHELSEPEDGNKETNENNTGSD